MSCFQYLIIAILVFSLILAAGCTGHTWTAVPAAPTPAHITLESLVLTPSEVPHNFTLAETRAKNSTDVSKLALAFGWKEGYVVRFTRSMDGEHGSTEILQTVTRYPEKNSAGIAELIEQQERTDSNIPFSNLSSS